MKITVEMSGVKYFIETEDEDLQFAELMDYIKSLTLAMGYTSDTVEDYFSNEN